MTIRCRDLPGWRIDPGDPSVGIFGTEAIHDTCPAWDETTSVIGYDAWVEMGRTYKPSPGMVEIISRLHITCGCGEVLTVWEWDVSFIEDSSHE